MKLFGILLLAISFTQCKSQKFEQNPPFTVHSATYTHISGGMPGNSSLDLMIEFTSDKSIEFEEVYFQEKTIKPVVEQKGDKQYLAARYKTSTEKSDLVLHQNTQEEYGNQPASEKKYAFELKENEAVISYKVNGKSHFYKLEDITKGESVFMPSVKPQNN